MCYSVVMAEEAAISSLSAVTPLSPLLETGATLKAHLLDGTYQIGRRKPGEGALGQVYTALHGPTHIQYALKRLRPELLAEPERLARLRRQAPQWALLRHPNLVSLVDWEAQAPGPAFLVSECVEAERLSDVLARRERPSSLEEALELCRQVGAALLCLHSAGVLHGALHPGNIFVTTGAQGERCYRVSDFGLAWLLQGPPGSPPAGLSVITASYLSPEQARGETRHLDGRCDQFALAALCYELLAGRPAFRQPNDDLKTVLRRVMDEDPVPVQLPHSLERALHRALQRNRESRFAGIKEFLAALTPEDDETRTSVLLPPTVLPRSGRPATGVVSLSGSGSTSLPLPLPLPVNRPATLVVALQRGLAPAGRRPLLGAAIGLALVAVLFGVVLLRRSHHAQRPPRPVAVAPLRTLPPLPPPPPPEEPAAVVRPLPPLPDQIPVVRPPLRGPDEVATPRPPNLSVRHHSSAVSKPPPPVVKVARPSFSPGRLSGAEQQGILGCLLRGPRLPAPLDLMLHGGQVMVRNRPSGAAYEPILRCLQALRFPPQPQPKYERLSQP